MLGSFCAACSICCSHASIAASTSAGVASFGIAGGVATSALEMVQNSERLSWTEEEVDQHLHKIMDTIYAMSVNAAEKYGLGYDLVSGANIAGFLRVAEAMMAQGIF